MLTTARLGGLVVSAAMLAASASAAPTVQLATGDGEDDIAVTLDAYGVTPGLIVTDPDEPGGDPRETTGRNPLSSTGLFIDFAGGNIRAVNDRFADTDADFAGDAGDGSVRSSFVIGALRFELTQTLSPVAASGEMPAGAVLNQTYTVTNTGAGPVEFGMTRVVNPRGSNTGGIETVNGSLRPYAFGADGNRYALDAEGGTDGGFGTLSELSDALIFAGPGTGDAFAAAFAGGTVSGDQDGDGVADSNRFDALAIRRLFSLAGGESATFSTATFLGVAASEGGGGGGGGGGDGPDRPDRPTGGGTENDPFMPNGPNGGGGGDGTPVDPNDGGGIVITYFPDMPFRINGRCIANCDELGVQYTLFQFIPAEFVLAVGDIRDGETYYFDPPITVGYTYAVEGADFQSVTAPTFASVADPDGYTLTYVDADGNLVSVALAAGETHVFSTVISEFFLYGIDEALGLGAGGDFVLGIAFTNIDPNGELRLTQTGYGIDLDEFDADAVPLPAGAILLLTGLGAGAGLRRGRRLAA